MRESHLRTPRTLADCQWTEGYPSKNPAESRAEAAMGVVLAIVIGICGAAILLHWWTS